MSALRIPLILAATLFAGACVSEPPRPRLPQLGTVEDDATWRISEAALSGGPGAVAPQVSAIARDYLRRGSGQISVVTAAPDSTRATIWSANLAQGLMSQGVRAEQIESTPVLSMTSPGAVVTYRSVGIVLPDCGGQPVRAAYLSACEVDRYLGRMAAHPADLLGRGALGDADSPRLSQGIEKYRQGEVKSAPSDAAARATTQ